MLLAIIFMFNTRIDVHRVKSHAENSEKEVRTKFKGKFSGKSFHVRYFCHLFSTKIKHKGLMYV